METRTYRIVNGMLYYTEGDQAIPQQLEPLAAPTTEQEPEGRIPVGGTVDELKTVVQGEGEHFTAPIAVLHQQPAAPPRAQPDTFDRPDAVPLYGRPNEDRTTAPESYGESFRMPVGQVHVQEPVDVAPAPAAPAETFRIPAGAVPPIDPPPLALTPPGTGETVRLATGQLANENRVEEEKR
jgi:hypothetical protein